MPWVFRIFFFHIFAMFRRYRFLLSASIINVSDLPVSQPDATPGFISKEITQRLLKLSATTANPTRFQLMKCMIGPLYGQFLMGAIMNFFDLIFRVTLTILLE